MVATCFTLFPTCNYIIPSWKTKCNRKKTHAGKGLSLVITSFRVGKQSVTERKHMQEKAFVMLKTSYFLDLLEN